MTMEATIEPMVWFDPNGWFKDEEPTAKAEFVEDRRVVIVDGVAGYVSCPDCIVDERVSDAELLTLAHSGEAEISCNRCKDTGKVWVSV